MQPGSSMNTDGIIVYENENADGSKKDDQVIIQYETPSVISSEKIRKGLFFTFKFTSLENLDSVILHRL